MSNNTGENKLFKISSVILLLIIIITLFVLLILAIKISPTLAFIAQDRGVQLPVLTLLLFSIS
ncbi:MAG: hypothetical protein ABH952_03490, partial [Candidatus Omnitrophota bacterium]